MARIVRVKPKRIISAKLARGNVRYTASRNPAARLVFSTEEERYQADALVRAGYDEAQRVVGFAAVELSPHAFIEPSLNGTVRAGIALWKGYGARTLHGLAKPNLERRPVGYVNVVEEA